MFPFFNNYPGTDLHEIDLAYILKLCAELRASNITLTEWKAEHEEEYKDLANKVEGLINNLVDVIVPWDSSIAYHVFSIVEYLGNNYIAIQDVPIGTMITNTNYWQQADTVVEQINAMALIVSALEQKAVHNYATVQDMINDVSLDSGVVCMTAGYYAAGDNGSAIYIIEDEAGQATTPEFQTLDNGKRAHLLSDKVNVLQWGVRQSSNADCLAEMQAAFDNADDRIIFIPEGNYYLSTPIVLTDMNYQILGDFKYPAWNNSHYRIICNAGFLYKSEAAGEHEIQISNINVASAAGTGKCFENIGFKHSVFDKCSFNGFEYVFYNSPFTYFSQILNCSFMSIKKAFLNFMSGSYTGLSQFEAEISGCYINGDRDSVAVAFETDTFNTMDVHDCYFDFLKYIMTSSRTNGNCVYSNARFHANTFDYVYRFMDCTMALSRYATNAGYMLITGNTFKNCNKTAGLGVFTNPDSDMENTDWGGIVFDKTDRPYGGWLNVVDNNFFTCDYCLKFEGADNWHNHTANNKFAQSTNTITYQNTVTTHTTYDALRTCSFEELNNKDVSALETNVQKKFINEIAYLNHVFYRVADNGVFYKADGTT